MNNNIIYQLKMMHKMQMETSSYGVNESRSSIMSLFALIFTSGTIIASGVFILLLINYVRAQIVEFVDPEMMGGIVILMSTDMAVAIVLILAISLGEDYYRQIKLVFYIYFALTFVGRLAYIIYIYIMSINSLSDRYRELFRIFKWPTIIEEGLWLSILVTYCMMYPSSKKAYFIVSNH